MSNTRQTKSRCKIAPGYALIICVSERPPHLRPHKGWSERRDEKRTETMFDKCGHSAFPYSPYTDNIVVPSVLPVIPKPLLSFLSSRLTPANQPQQKHFLVLVYSIPSVLTYPSPPVLPVAYSSLSDQVTSRPGRADR